MARFTRNRTRNTRSYRKKKNSAAANANAIKGIQRSLRADRNQYGLSHEKRISSVGDVIVPVFPALVASAYSPAWGNIFADSELAITAGRMTIPNVHVDMQFTAYTEGAPTTFSVFHVKLLDATCDDLIAVTTRSLSGIGSNGQYITRGTFSGTAGLASGNSMVRCNPRYFDVKKEWHFTLGGSLAVSPSLQISTSMHDSIKNIRYTVPMGNQVLGSGIGEWSSLDADSYKSRNLNYILVFTDNSTLEGESPSGVMYMTTIGTAQE